MAVWTQENRDKLDKDDFGDPENRKFPIKDQSDVDDAAHLIGKAGNPEAVKKRIKAIAKRKGFKIPEAWEKDEANMEATFDTSSSPLASLGDMVLRDAPVIFKCGDYPDKGFTLTPEEAKKIVVPDFESRKNTDPVYLRPSHTKNPLDKKIGRIAALGVKDDGVVFGKVAIPKWLDEAFKGQPIPLSAGFDRATKKLTHVALVDSPRVSGARIEAAFADYRKTRAEQEAEIFRTLAEVKFDLADGDAPSHKDKMQRIHDMTASFGASCREGTPASAEAKDGQPYFELLQSIFESSPENKALQSIHDTTADAGAECNSRMKSLKTGTSSQPDVLQTAQAAQAASTDSSGQKGYTFTMTQTTDPAVLALQQQFATFAKTTDQKLASLETENKQLKADKEALRQEKLKDECTNFAKEMVRDRRIMPFQEQAVYFELLQAGEDDHRNPVEVTFDVSGQQHKGTRLDAKKASLKQNPQHVFNQELLKDGGTPVTILFDNNQGGAGGDEKSKQHGSLFKKGEWDSLMNMTHLGRAVAEDRQGRRQKAAAK